MTHLPRENWIQRWTTLFLCFTYHKCATFHWSKVWRKHLHHLLHRHALPVFPNFNFYKSDTLYGYFTGKTVSLQRISLRWACEFTTGMTVGLVLLYNMFQTRKCVLPHCSIHHFITAGKIYTFIKTPNHRVLLLVSKSVSFGNIQIIVCFLEY